MNISEEVFETFTVLNFNLPNKEEVKAVDFEALKKT
eukprot:CAMPEP_0170551694 /NCGR_PEP_ID=MMETSP0211-20121228/9695_1 /TAXON_ID=311385 /ORGANISM="Pseudokeronopsis sp., Strain OXSARD2" /LENGTH=35 /DNA_ID= /DNA_START= /DNA_END= /DNA_ORIENTATION=